MARASESRLLLVVPSVLPGAAAIDSRRIAAGQLALAVARRVGGVDVLTPEGLQQADRLVSGAVRPAGSPSAVRTIGRHLPALLRPAIGDLREWDRGRRLRHQARALDGSRYELVIQLHHRFQDAGLVVAERLGIPCIMRIEALEVREERAWGVRRPGWSDVVERIGEARPLERASTIASVSDAVDAQVESLGIDSERRMVLPNGVDVERFSPGQADPDIRRSIDPGERFIVGWVGGFRPFHGLGQVPAVLRRLRDRWPEVLLCLVGTGPLRAEVEHQLAGLREWVRVMPAIPHGDVPRWIRSFDACVMLGDRGDFHYSPLKLFEYLACGKPVVASAVGQVVTLVEDEREALLVPPGDGRAVADAIGLLRDRPALAASIAAAGRRAATTSWSWEARADELLDSVGGRIPSARYLD